jgi:hypothetical protein
MEKFLEFDIAIINNFETNESDIIYILLQRRLDASCIIFKLKIRIIRIYSFNYNGPRDGASQPRYQARLVWVKSCFCYYVLLHLT